MRCSGPFSFCASERVDVTNTRLAPTRSASATTASPAGVPTTMRSWAVIWKVPDAGEARGSLMVCSDRIAGVGELAYLTSVSACWQEMSMAWGAIQPTPIAPALRLRRASGQHFGEHLAVDVAAAQDEAHAFAAHAVALPQQSGK